MEFGFQVIGSDSLNNLCGLSEILMHLHSDEVSVNLSRIPPCVGRLFILMKKGANAKEEEPIRSRHPHPRRIHYPTRSCCSCPMLQICTVSDCQWIHSHSTRCPNQ